MRLLKRGDGPIIGKRPESVGAPPGPPKVMLESGQREESAGSSCVIGPPIGTMCTILASDIVSIELDNCVNKNTILTPYSCKTGPRIVASTTATSRGLVILREHPHRRTW